MSAERQLRYRRRAMRGKVVVAVEIDVDDAEALIEAELLASHQADDRSAIEGARARARRLARLAITWVLQAAAESHGLQRLETAPKI